MKFFETSKYFSLKKSTYINLRWIAIIGQLITVNLIYYILNFDFDLTLANLIILLGVLSNLYLVFINNNTQLSDKIASFFLLTISEILSLIINKFSSFSIDRASVT